MMHAFRRDGHMTILQGAQNMFAGDLLESFRVEDIDAIHKRPGAPVGKVSKRTGQNCSNEGLSEILIVRQAGHASMPRVGHYAITIGVQLERDHLPITRNESE